MATKTILSWEDFLAAGKEGHKSEWVDGEVITMAPVPFGNAVILMRLMASLATFCDAHADWLWVPSNAVFTMASGNWRCPDASLFRKERFRGEIPRTKADFAPDVAFEILSPSNTPSILQRKRQDYHQSGIIQVWIDPEQPLVELVAPDRPLQYFQPPQALVIGSIPGFRVELEKLFAA